MQYVLMYVCLYNYFFLIKLITNLFHKNKEVHCIALVQCSENHKYVCHSIK